MADVQRDGSESSLDSLTKAQRSFLDSCRHNESPQSKVPVSATRAAPTQSLATVPPGASARTPKLLHNLFSPVGLASGIICHAPSPPPLQSVTASRVASPRKMKFKMLTVNPSASPQQPQSNRAIKSSDTHQQDSDCCTFFRISPSYFSPLRRNALPGPSERHPRLPDLPVPMRD
jgi:hypothetical protein